LKNYHSTSRRSHAAGVVQWLGTEHLSVSLMSL